MLKMHVYRRKADDFFGFKDYAATYSRRGMNHIDPRAEAEELSAMAARKCRNALGQAKTWSAVETRFVLPAKGGLAR